MRMRRGGGGECGEEGVRVKEAECGLYDREGEGTVVCGFGGGGVYFSCLE